MIDTFKSLMSNMADTITRQMSEQVKKAMDTAGSAQPVPAGGFLHRPESRPSSHPREHGREVTRSERSARLPLGRQEGRVAVDLEARTSDTAPAASNDGTPWASKRLKILRSRHTTIECRELEKALDELADKGQIDRFLKRGPRSLRQERVPARPPPWDEEFSTEIVTTIARGHAEEITRTAWKAQLRSAQQVLAFDQGPCIAAPTMVFGGKDAREFASPHNDPLVVEMKIPSAIVRRILVDTGSYVDIIKWTA
ncbi:hypothetical protein Cgig2_018480 [Carnegiea gigantea]|uniref:Uncharacterized protein n=1 Tax=Carnegiea gigantea TaxID=171969 RepID=A0A9Q1Q4M7_9CARY|nr:hypothetical protein Cgig2_018480 [Carnegiea gigantea]